MIARDSINVTEQNALEFMLTENNDLVRRYICSQLKINHHLKPILELMHYKGEFYDPLVELVNNNPLLWKEIIKYENNVCEIYDDDFFFKIMNASELIYDIEVNIKEQLKTLRDKLEKISKYNIFGKKVINCQINELEQQLIEEKWAINHYYSDDEVQRQWKLFIKDTMHFLKSKQEKISSTSIFNCMLDNFSINVYLDNLKRDIVLNYNLIMYTFFNKDKNQSLKEILDEIIIIFDDFSFNQTKTKYRDFNYEKHDKKMFSNISSYLKIEEKMEILNNKYEVVKQIEDYDLYVKEVIEIFQEFIKISPYNQNNGRISRYLFNLLLLKRGIIPPTLYDNHSKRYQIDRLSDQYLLGNKNLLNDYIFDRIKMFNNEVSKEKIKIKTK